MESIVEFDGKNEKRTVNFMGAKLPDGTDIAETLRENQKLKKELKDLETKALKERALLSVLIPNKKIRDVVELALIIMGILGIITLFI